MIARLRRYLSITLVAARSSRSRRGNDMAMAGHSRLPGVVERNLIFHVAERCDEQGDKDLAGGRHSRSRPFGNKGSPCVAPCLKVSTPQYYSVSHSVDQVLPYMPGTTLLDLSVRRNTLARGPAAAASALTPSSLCWLHDRDQDVWIERGPTHVF